MTAHPGQIQSNPIDDLCDATAALKVLSTLMTDRPNEVILGQDDLHGLNVLFRAATDRLEQVYEALTYEKLVARRKAEVRPMSGLESKLKATFDDLVREARNKDTEETGDDMTVYPIINMPDAEEAGRAAVG